MKLAVVVDRWGIFSSVAPRLMLLIPLTLLLLLLLLPPLLLACAELTAAGLGGFLALASGTVAAMTPGLAGRSGLMNVDGTQPSQSPRLTNHQPLFVFSSTCTRSLALRL